MSQTQPVATPPDVTGQLDRKAKREYAIQEMEKHLSVAPDGTIVLGVKSAGDIRADPDAFDELTKSLEQVNVLLRTDQLYPAQVRLQTRFTRATAVESVLTAAGTCAGTDSSNFYWWGIVLDVDECITAEIEGALKVGQGAAAIAALISGPTGAGTFAFALAGAIAGLAATLLQWIDGLGGNHGITFNITWLFVISWVWHQ